MKRCLSLIIGFLLLISFILPAPVNALDWSWLPWVDEQPIDDDIIQTQSVVLPELIQLRAENSKTYQLSNGNRRLEIEIGAIHYKDDYSNSYEQWKDIDTTIVNGRIDKAPYILEIDYANKSVTMMDKKTGSVTTLSLQTIGDEVPNPVALSALSKGKASWNNIASNTDFEIVADNTRVSLTRILKNSDAPLKAQFAISQMGNGIVVRTLARDADGENIPVQSTIKSGILTETINDTDLAGKKYPIEIDPTLTIQPSDKDNRMIQDIPDTNYGATNSLDIQSQDTNRNRRSIVQFSITWGTDIPNDAIISSANLSLNIYSIVDAVGRTHEAYRLLETRLDWVEAEATWNIYKTGSNWTAAGGDYVNDATKAQATVPAAIGWIDWTVTDQVKWAQLNSVNIGFLLRDATESADATARRTTSRSKEDANAGLKPKLVIEYTLPVPITVTNAATNVEETTATFNGNITDGTNVDMRGFAYGTTSNATLPVNEEPPASYTSNWTEVGAFGNGAFSHNVVGLTEGELYYYRAFSHNGTGWGWGDEESFLTKPVEPTNLVCTAGDGQVSLTWATGSGFLNTVITYNTTGYPTAPDDGTLSYNSTGVSTTQGGLVNGVLHYFTAWSWDADGGYSNYSDLSVNCTSTPVVSGLTVTTLPCTGFDSEWAIVNGSVDAFSGLSTFVASRGFDYGLTDVYGSSLTESGTWGLEAFSGTLTSLSPATVYHYRAKAQDNIGGWYYGEDKVFATKGSPTPYETWSTGDDGDSIEIYGANWTYQTFTTNTTDVAHSVTSIKLYLKRVGASPGIVTASIMHSSNCTAPSCYCFPTGAAMVSGTLDADTFGTTATWYEFVMDSEVCLAANTTYAIVLKADSADSSNYVQWRWDAGGGYPGGNAGHSNDSGSTWTNDCPADYLFEIWGEPCLEVNDAKVFTSYINDGDWLITCLYKNLYPPYYEDGADVSTLFYLQLVDGNDVKAQTKVFDWGYRPGSIYLASNMTESLEWGHDYYVRMQGDFGDNPYMEYVLTGTDWMGSDLTRLDSWVRSTAILMEDYYSITLTEYISGKGIVLNEDGGVIFATNIPELEKVRPDIFQIVTSELGFTQGEFTHSYQDELVWQVMLGEQLTRAYTTVGNSVGLSGSTIGALIGLIIYACVAALSFPPGHAIAAVVIPVPLLVFIWGTGLAELALMGILLAVAVILFIWQFWLKGA